MNEKLLIICTLLNIIVFATANDVLGCGGFIKSHVQIDFSKVVIKLYTKQGILKDQTNCAPNNGYYFIPLYDKGDYLLQLEPPPGWSFDPLKVSVAIDGKNDICSQGKDINFVFKGFGITGRVETSGSVGQGPPGVGVELKSDKEIRTAVSGENGIFFFTPVYPGKYTVTISHPKWRLTKKSLSVLVTEGNTELAPHSLVIGGYDVTGSVKSDGEPIKGVTIVLYSDETNKNIEVEGCSKAKISGYDAMEKPLCHVASDESGNFVFPSLVNGKYFVKPFYKDQKIHFEPRQIKFAVSHDSLLLREVFEIVGFSIPGRVLNSQNGEPLGDAEVVVNNENLGFTKQDGFYSLEKVKAGTYNILVHANNYKFESASIKINPSLMQLPDIYPSSYKVCGIVVSDKAESATISITKLGSTFHLSTISDASTGQFCEYLPRGKYDMQVNTEHGDKANGLQFFPISQIVEVTSQPIFDVTFSQLKATINGKIECMINNDCSSIKVILRPNNNAFGDKDTIEEIRDGIYTFNDIRPGTYHVLLTSNSFCWNENEYTISVTSSILTVPQFVQTGHVIAFISSHNSKIYYNSSAVGGSKVELAITAGRSHHCVPKAGNYTFTLDSCHTYPTNTIDYATDSEKNDVILMATKHRLTLDISAVKDFGKLVIATNIGGMKVPSTPLTYKNNKYQLDLHLSPGEKAVLIPQSDILYFEPPILTLSGENDCVDLGTKFVAMKGRLFKGKITPPLEGVQITIESENTEALMQETDQDGVYKFQPLDDTKTYKITAVKESYIMIGPDEDGNILAHKLAEVIVEVVDKTDNLPLQGALMSLSGGQSYRSNMQTNEHGKIVFPSLSPSEYFLRPMMKEYSFEPASKIINVEVGATVKVLLKGKRVAYSAFGQVTSLNNQPEERMVVVAAGTANCSQYSEEATSESNGHFRIRGLTPYCTYELAVAGSLDDKETIERSTPKIIKIPSISKDVTDLKMVVFRTIANTDILVKVYTENPEHYKSLRIKITRETSPSAMVHMIKIDTTNYKIQKDYNSGILVQVPAIPLDGKTYSIQLESTSSQLNKGKSKAQYFTTDGGFKFIEFDFVVKSNVTGENIKQTSVWTLAFIFGTMIIAYNIDQIVQILKMKFPKFNLEMLKPKPAATEYQQPDNNDIDQIVESINATKRKVKPKRI